MRLRNLYNDLKKKSFTTPEAYFKEANRYYENAKQRLKECKVEYNHYVDLKPVREACATGYLAVLLALDGYLLKRGVPPESFPKSTQGYWALVAKYLTRNGRVRAAFEVAYENLHVFGYYRGAKDPEVVKSGFKNAKLAIATLSGEGA